MPNRPRTILLQSVGQVVAVILMVAYFALLLHKGTKDMAALADAHPEDFWLALGRHLLRVLGGG